jgi:hypothetical protein
MTGQQVYRTSPIKRERRTRAQLADLDAAIIGVCEDDHPMTVRGVFYRVMSAGAVSKTEQSYKAVQRRTLELRRSGELPYHWIVDGTRWQVKEPSWDTVEDALDDAAASYRRALWNDQHSYVEVWSEKDAISGIISPVTSEWDVPLMIARGFASETFLWSTGNTINSIAKPTTIYQLGDHDPSGVAAWEHTQARLREFCPYVPIDFVRLAVTPSQIEELRLPTRPTKTTDSRSRTFAGASVEVDAIPTSTLRALVSGAIESHIDSHALRLTRMVEAQEREDLRAMADGWAT